MISEITFKEIKPMWERLWPGRDFIRPVVSMTSHSTWDLSIYEKAQDGEGLYAGKFFGVYNDRGELVAVNSGHQTSDTHFRSRGLFVAPGYGGRGLGQLLLQTVINLAEENDFEMIWSFPKVNAFKTYRAVGFKCYKGEYKDTYQVNGVMQKGWNSYAEKKLK